MQAGFSIRQVIGLLAGLSSLVGAVQAGGDPAAGKWKADTCMGCHGVSNYFSVYPSYRVPKLFGQHGDYLVTALNDYRTGARRHPTMRANAGALSDQDIYDIAAYFSGETVTQAAPAPAAAEPEAEAAPAASPAAEAANAPAPTTEPAASPPAEAAAVAAAAATKPALEATPPSARKGSGKHARPSR